MKKNLLLGLNDAHYIPSLLSHLFVLPINCSPLVKMHSKATSDTWPTTNSALYNFLIDMKSLSVNLQWLGHSGRAQSTQSKDSVFESRWLLSVFSFNMGLIR